MFSCLFFNLPVICTEGYPVCFSLTAQKLHEPVARNHESLLPACLSFFLLRNMFCVWRAYLEGTVQATQSRLSACDNYKLQVADAAKTARLQKEQQLRKVIQVNYTTLLRFHSLLAFLSQVKFICNSFHKQGSFKSFISYKHHAVTNYENM